MAIFDFFKKKNNTEAVNESATAQKNFSEDDISNIKESDVIETAEIDYSDNDMSDEEMEFQDKADLSNDIEQEPVFEPETARQPKIGLFKKILAGLDKTKKNISTGVENVLKSFVKIDAQLFDELEEVLIMSDIGVETSARIIEALKDRVRTEKVSEVSQIKKLLADEITKILIENDEPLELRKPAVVLIIGVNGVGKTTTIGKLTQIYKNAGNKILLAAADTFRAAAIDQLGIWAERNGVDMIRQQEGSDPAAVVFDAVNAAKARKTDILFCDTAGRLHNKKNLMDELKKIFRIISQNYPEAQLEVFLVLDATTGQNALQQAKVFKEAANITGIVLTKLDGTAKGGIVIAVKNELKIPVRFVGVGEAIDDLQPFNAAEFARALFTDMDGGEQ